jgi:hypothetical protein
VIRWTSETSKEDSELDDWIRKLTETTQQLMRDAYAFITPEDLEVLRQHTCAETALAIRAPKGAELIVEQEQNTVYAQADELVICTASEQ